MIIVILGIGFMPLTHQVFGEENVPKQILPANGSELGNWNTPIVLNSKEVKKYSQLEYQLQEYIREHYEGYEILGRTFTLDDDSGHFILILSLKNEEGKKKRVHFDMTDLYKKLSASKDKETRKKIKELENKHNPKD